MRNQQISLRSLVAPISCALLVLAGLACAEDPPDGHDHGHGHDHGSEDGQGEEHGGHAADHPVMQHDGPSESHGGGMRHDFSDAEHWAGLFEGEERDVWQKPEHVVSLLALEEGMTVADLGAGTGYFLPWLQRAVGAEGRVLGLDPEQGMVDWMTARAEREALSAVEVRKVPFDDPGLESGEADRILVVDTWHHIGDRVEYVGKLCRALAAGGALYVVDFTLDAPFGPPARHRLTAEQVGAELAAGGLAWETATEELPHQWVVVGRRPAECPE